MTRPAAATNPLLLLPLIHDTLRACPDAPGHTHAAPLRDAMRAYVIATLAACSSDGRAIPSRRASKILCVSTKTLQRWTAPGGCCAP